MNISESNFVRKLKEGWAVLEPNGTTTYFIKKTDGLKLKFNTDGSIDIINDVKDFVGCRPIGLIKGDTKYIAVDKVVPDSKAMRKPKIKLIICSTYLDTDYAIACYVIYKAIKTYGFDNVSVELFDWQQWQNSEDKDNFANADYDTEVLCVGFDKSNHPSSKYKTIGCVKWNWCVEKHTGGIINKLKSIGVSPEITIEDEKEKLKWFAGNVALNGKYKLHNFIYSYMQRHELNIIFKLLTTDSFLYKAMDAYMTCADNLNSDKVDLFNSVPDLKKYVNTMKKTGVELHIVMLAEDVCNLASSKTIHIELPEKVYRFGGGYVAQPILKAIPSLYPTKWMTLLKAGDHLEIYVEGGKDFSSYDHMLKTINSEIVPYVGKLSKIEIYLKKDKKI